MKLLTEGIIVNICILHPINDSQKEYASYYELTATYVVSMLRQVGHHVDFYFETAAVIYSIVTSKRYDVIGIEGQMYNHLQLTRIAIYCKQKYSTMFLFSFGYYPTLTYNQLHNDFNFIDCMIIGEADLTVCRLMEAFNNKSWKHIKGIAYREENEVHYTGKGETIADLDTIPFPARTPGIHVEDSIYTSRGCKGKCIYCKNYVLITTSNCKRIRKRSVKNVVDEIQYLVHNYQTKKIVFADDNFSFSSKHDKEWFDELHALVLRSKLDVSYRIEVRPDDIDCDYLMKFKEIGLTDIFIGIESLIQKQLDFYQKETTVEDNIRAIKIIDEMGFILSIGFLLFNPLTRLEDILKTVHIFREIEFNKGKRFYVNLISSSAVIAYPNTNLFSYIEKENITAQNQRGYIIPDEEAELCYQVMLRWAVQTGKVTGKIKIYQLAQRSNDNSLLKKINNILYQLFNIDIDFLEMIAVHIRKNKKWNTEQHYDHMIAKWSVKLQPLCDELDQLKHEIDNNTDRYPLIH